MSIIVCNELSQIITKPIIARLFTGPALDPFCADFFHHMSMFLKGNSEASKPTEKGACLLGSYLMINFNWVLGLSTRTTYRVSDDVVGMAGDLRHRRILPTNTHVFQVPVFLIFNTDEGRNTLMWIPQKHALEAQGIYQKEMEKHNISTYGTLETEMLKEFCGFGILLQKHYITIFAVDEEDLNTQTNKPEQTKAMKTISDSFQLATKLSMLLKAQGAPIQVSENREKVPREKRTGPHNDAIAYTVTIAPDRLIYQKKETQETLNKEGLVLSDVSVVGHLRWQPHGQGNKERKLIYVSEFVGKRWCVPERFIDVESE